MKALFQMSWRLLKFYARAQTRQRVHSPFVFEFTERVLDDKRQFYAFSEIEYLRKSLLKADETVEVRDLGAGSHVSGTSRQRKVSEIARASVSPRFECEVLFRLVEWLQPRTMVELGTSLGVSALYMATAARRDAQLVTLEGAPMIAQLAKRNWAWFHQHVQNANAAAKYTPQNHKDVEKNKTVAHANIELVEGNFDQTFPQVLKNLERLDFAFIDGDHRKEPTLRYFEQSLPYIHADSVLIFDDIHWSAEMESAWETVKNHESVRISIDLFWCGIVFFRSENREKEHFQLLPARVKPFSLGFFG